MNPTEGKITCAEAVRPFVEAGNTHLPAPSLTRWVAEFLEELASFPRARTTIRSTPDASAATHLSAGHTSQHVPEAARAAVRELRHTDPRRQRRPVHHCAPEDSHHHMTGPPLGR